LTILINSNLVIAWGDLRQFKAEFFKALAHPLRIAVLDTVRDGELGVNELSARLKVEQSSLSQQLATLRARNLVTGRKEGLNVYYSVTDPRIFKLLDVARHIFESQLSGMRDMLSAIRKETRA
jgi:ArsR family transcriptional regulator